MFSKDTRIGAIVISLLISIPLFGAYYKNTLFPIGLTGINFTGNYTCPFGNEGWTWSAERALINELGINVIGSSDAYPNYLVDFKPEDPSEYNYLNQICMLSNNPARPNPIYIITNSYYVDNTKFTNYHLDPTGNTVTVGPARNVRSCNLFRGPYRCRCHNDSNYTSPWGDPKFAPDASVGGSSLYGTTTDNWNTYGGDDPWRWMADNAVENLEDYFTAHPTYAQYFWGLGLIVEDPAISRYDGEPHNCSVHPWHGAWRAVNRVFSGQDASHGGVRGVENSVLGGEQRMFIAKGSVWPMAREDFNIFASLPDLDAFVIYSHGWCHADWNYGAQDIFDYFLYGDNPCKKLGRHHVAEYFKDYGGTSGGPAGQERRWIAAICVEWQIDTLNLFKALARRPCPPEIRCAAYLALSRGAKGILFHPWTYSYRDPDTVDLDPSNIPIPSYTSHESYFNLGLRDQAGYPFGEGGPRHSTHKLNSGEASLLNRTHWHNYNNDYTYDYLAHTLIPEIKHISPWLVALDWDTAFSRNKMPYEIMQQVRYIKACRIMGSVWPLNTNVDVGIYEPMGGHDFFMVVNRDKIARNDPSNVRIKIDGSKGEWLTNLSESRVHRLPKEKLGSDRILKQEFAPGQGKLYAIGTNPKIPPKPPALEVHWVHYGQASPGEAVDLYPCMWRAKLTWTFDRQDWSFDSYRAYRLGMFFKGPLGCILMFDAFENIGSYTHRTCEDWHNDIGCGALCYQTGERGKWRLDAAIHKSGAYDTLKSNEVNMTAPPCTVYNHCPNAYVWVEDDLYGQCNSLLPHSEYVSALETDLLVLDIDPGAYNHSYFINIIEQTDETHLFGGSLWVVDHPADAQIGSTADGQILPYTDVVFPYTCYDQNLASQLEIMDDPAQTFVGATGDYLTVTFPDYGWEKKALLVYVGNVEQATAPYKDNYIQVCSWTGDTTEEWIPEGHAYTRQLPTTCLIDVSDDTMSYYRLNCIGEEMHINSVYLVKIDTTNVTTTEAPINAVILWEQSLPGGVYQPSECYGDFVNPNNDVSLDPFDQLAISFQEVPQDTSRERTFVLQTSGYYEPVGGGGRGGEQSTTPSLRFDLEVQALHSLRKAMLISYEVPVATDVKIAIVDIAGRVVAEPLNEEVTPGRHQLEWDWRDNAGRKVASGVYFVKMNAGDFAETKKVVITR